MLKYAATKTGTIFAIFLAISAIGYGDTVARRLYTEDKYSFTNKLNGSFESLQDVTEFCGITQDISPGELLALADNRQLYVLKDKMQDKNTQLFLVARADGKIVAISFRDGECTGIQRLPDLSKKDIKRLILSDNKND